MHRSLTREQREEFDLRGVLRLERFFREEDIELMRDHLWEDLERRYKLRREQPDSWTVATPGQFQTLKHSDAFAALDSPRLRALADALIGAGAWDKPERWGVPLVTFPTQAPVLPRPPWHLDIGGVERLTPLPSLRIFTFLEPVESRGGGTLYVAGSHQLALEFERVHGGAVRSAQVREWLKMHPWFASLLATPTVDLRPLMNIETRVGGHIVSFEEMTGEPGDLIVMNPALLHGTGHNARDRPRIMLTETIRRRARGVK